MKHEIDEAWCGQRSSLQCEFERLNDIAKVDGKDAIHVEWQDLHKSHAYVCPDKPLLEELVSLGPIVEIGAGTGYWARLISDMGGDVVAIDVRASKSSPWCAIIQGDERLLDQYPDRTLLMVRPFNGQSEAVVSKWKGSRMIVVQQGPFPNKHNGMDGRLIEILNAGGWQAVGGRKLWDPFDDGFLIHTFERQQP